MNYPPFATWFENWAPVLARVILGGTLLFGASMKIPGSEMFTMMVQMTGAVGVPMPEIAVTLAFLLELGAGIVLVLGYRARVAATALIPFLVLLTWLFHMPNPADPMSMGIFIDRLIYIALLLYIAVYGARHFALR